MEPERVQEEKWHLLINIFFSTVKFLAYFYLDPDSAKPGSGSGFSKTWIRIRLQWSESWIFYWYAGTNNSLFWGDIFPGSWIL